MARPPSRGPNRDALHVIGKRTLENVETLRPAPGKTAAHGEFDKVGTYALVSIWETDGAVVVYGAATLKEAKRLPVVKPSGKYNVHNNERPETGNKAPAAIPTPHRLGDGPPTGALPAPPGSRRGRPATG